jgi:hypothetical protein
MFIQFEPKVEPICFEEEKLPVAGIYRGPQGSVQCQHWFGKWAEHLHSSCTHIGLTHNIGKQMGAAAVFYMLQFTN